MDLMMILQKNYHQFANYSLCLIACSISIVILLNFSSILFLFLSYTWAKLNFSLILLFLSQQRYNRIRAQEITPYFLNHFAWMNSLTVFVDRSTHKKKPKKLKNVVLIINSKELLGLLFSLKDHHWKKNHYRKYIYLA